jgi:hypothetical protein
MKIIIFFIFLQQIDSVKVLPTGFNVGDSVEIIVSLSGISNPQNEIIYFYVGDDFNQSVISPDFGYLDAFGNYRGKHVIYRAGVDSLVCVYPPLNLQEWSNTFEAFPLSPSGVQILFIGQGHRPGELDKKGREELSFIPQYPVRQTVKFVLNVVDQFYNLSPFSDSLRVRISTDDPYAVYSDVVIPPNRVTDTFEVTFKRATVPWQISPSDARHLWAKIYIPSFTPDTFVDSIRYNRNSPYFHILAGSYSKLLLLEKNKDIFDPGNELIGKIDNQEPLNSGVPFFIEVKACDYFFNRVSYSGGRVILRFETSLPSGSYVNPDTVNFQDGSAEFEVMISEAGIYPVFAYDIDSLFESRREVLDIRGNFYTISVDPDTIIANTQKFDVTIRYFDYKGDPVNSSHKLILGAYLCSDTSQKAAGSLSDTVINMEQGFAYAVLRYYTQQSEWIVIKVKDTFPSSKAFYSNCINVKYYPDVSQDFNLFPNPFGNIEQGDRLNIMFYLPESSEVEILIYDLFGRRIRKIDLGTMNVGRHIVFWDGKNDAGRKVASGAYVLVLKAVKGAKRVLNKKATISVIW